MRDLVLVWRVLMAHLDFEGLLVGDQQFGNRLIGGLAGLPDRLVVLEAGVVVVGALGDDDFEVHDDPPSALF